MFAFIQDRSLTAINRVEQYQYHTFRPSFSFSLIRRLVGAGRFEDRLGVLIPRIVHTPDDSSLPILRIGWHSDWRGQPNRNNGIWDAASVARGHA